MAVTFTLSATGTSIDLTDNTENFFLQEGLYLPAGATPTGDNTIPPYVIETMPVGVQSDTYNGYATLFQRLAFIQKQAAEYWVNQQQEIPVYLTCKMDGETGSRRALVKAISFEFRSWEESLYQECAGAVPPDHLFGTLIVERHPYWEDTSDTGFPNVTPAAAASVAYDYTSTADIVGDVPARIAGLGIRGATGGGVIIERLWMGVRSATLHGATGVTGFVPVWECEAGTNSTDASVADDGAATEPATASPGGAAGDYVHVDPDAVGYAIDWDDGVFHRVFRIKPTDTGSAVPDALGRFLWLLRCKTTAGEWEVRTACSGYSLNNQSTSDPISVTNTNWDYKEMGVHTIGLRNRQSLGSGNVSFVTENVWMSVLARRISGAGDLLLDCLCPIPIDEGFLKIQDAGMLTDHDCWFAQGPKEDTCSITIYDTAADIFSDTNAFEAETFRLPPGDGRIFCVYARILTSVLTDRIEFGDNSAGVSTFYERWTALRGSE